MNSRSTKKLKSKKGQCEQTFTIGSLSGIKGQFKSGLVPEIKIRYNKGKRILGKISTSSDVANFIRSQYKTGLIDAQEFFNILYLDRSNKILGYFQSSKGGISGTVVDPKIIFSVALKSLSSGIILSHNHPSGNLKPSQSDIAITKKLKEGAKALDISVLDHIIVTKSSYFSFADEGLI